MFLFIDELDERTYLIHIFMTVVDENRFFQSDDLMKLTKLC